MALDKYSGWVYNEHRKVQGLPNVWVWSKKERTMSKAMSLFIRVLIITVIGVVGGLALKSQLGQEAVYAADIKSSQVAEKLHAAAYNKIAAPDIPATYYVDNVTECFEIAFIVPADSLYPTIVARQRITKVTSNVCREAKDAGKLVVYPDDGPDAEIADLK